jgi:hypothetical protein
MVGKAKFIWTAVSILPSGVGSYFVQRALETSKILDPMADRLGRWIATTISSEAMAWITAAIVFAIFYGVLCWLIWHEKKTYPSLPVTNHEDSSAAVYVKDGDDHAFKDLKVNGGGYRTGIHIEGGKRQTWTNVMVSGAPHGQISGTLAILIQRLREVEAEETEVSDIENQARVTNLSPDAFRALIKRASNLLKRYGGQA